MKLEIYVFCLLLIESSRAASIKDYDELAVLGSGLGVPCSTNASAAWNDLIFVIDISSNMGNSNLQKLKSTLSLLMGSYPMAQEQFKTRVAIITFSTTASTVMGLTDSDGLSDFTSKLNGIQIKSDDKNSNLNKGLDMAYSLIQTQIASSFMGKPLGVVILAAGINTAYLNDISQMATNIRQYSTIVSVNFNPSDMTLGNVLNGISNPNMVYYSSSNTLSSDLNWAFMQTNCHCPRSYGMQFTAFDPNTNKMTRFAECYIILNWGNIPPGMNSLTMCQPNYQVSILNQEKNDFVQNSIGLAQFGVAQFYISLHKTTAQKWVWYDYDGTEIPLNYTNWESTSSSPDNCVIGDKLADGTYPWKQTSCFPATTGITHTVCAKLACDANRKSCISAGTYGKTLIKNKGLYTMLAV